MTEYRHLPQFRAEDRYLGMARIKHEGEVAFLDNPYKFDGYLMSEIAKKVAAWKRRKRVRFDDMEDAAELLAQIEVLSQP